MIIYNMSNADKCYGEKQAGKCKREFRGARQGAIFIGDQGKTAADIFGQKPESSKRLSNRLLWGKKKKEKKSSFRKHSSKCKSPEAEVCLSGARKTKKASVTGVE